MGVSQLSTPPKLNGPVAGVAVAYFQITGVRRAFQDGWRVSDPFDINGPAVISFSGGRTSAYMLWRILQAHGGTLPDDVHVTFANTGKESPETLRFVHECGSRWGIPIHWIEWRDNEPGFTVVGLNSASRIGEPFDALIDKKQRLPNGGERWCTEYLKVRPIWALMRSLGHGEPGDYAELIGLRFDEGHRVLKGLARAKKDGRLVRDPLADLGVTKRDVRDFWWGEGRRYETSVQPQGFDLGLPDLWGNCNLCFAMGVAIRRERVRQRPEVAQWWLDAEARTGGTFAFRETVADIVRDAAFHQGTPDLFDDAPSDAECGDMCGGDTPAEIAALQAEFERGAG